MCACVYVSVYCVVQRDIFLCALCISLSEWCFQVSMPNMQKTEVDVSVLLCCIPPYF